MCPLLASLGVLPVCLRWPYIKPVCWLSSRSRLSGFGASPWAWCFGGRWSLSSHERAQGAHVVDLLQHRCPDPCRGRALLFQGVRLQEGGRTRSRCGSSSGRQLRAVYPCEALGL